MSDAIAEEGRTLIGDQGTDQPEEWGEQTEDDGFEKLREKLMQKQKNRKWKIRSGDESGSTTVETSASESMPSVHPPTTPEEDQPPSRRSPDPAHIESPVQRAWESSLDVHEDDERRAKLRERLREMSRLRDRVRQAEIEARETEELRQEAAARRKSSARVSVGGELEEEPPMCAAGAWMLVIGFSLVILFPGIYFLVSVPAISATAVPFIFIMCGAVGVLVGLSMTPQGTKLRRNVARWFSESRTDPTMGEESVAVLLAKRKSYSAAVEMATEERLTTQLEEEERRLSLSAARAFSAVEMAAEQQRIVAAEGLVMEEERRAVEAATSALLAMAQPTSKYSAVEIISADDKEIANRSNEDGRLYVTLKEQRVKDHEASNIISGAGRDAVRPVSDVDASQPHLRGADVMAAEDAAVSANDIDLGNGLRSSYSDALGGALGAGYNDDGAAADDGSTMFRMELAPLRSDDHGDVIQGSTMTGDAVVPYMAEDRRNSIVQSLVHEWSDRVAKTSDPKTKVQFGSVRSAHVSSNAASVTSMLSNEEAEDFDQRSTSNRDVVIASVRRLPNPFQNDLAHALHPPSTPWSSPEGHVSAPTSMPPSTTSSTTSTNAVTTTTASGATIMTTSVDNDSPLSSTKSLDESSLVFSNGSTVAVGSDAVMGVDPVVLVDGFEQRLSTSKSVDAAVGSVATPSESTPAESAYHNDVPAEEDYGLSWSRSTTLELERAAAAVAAATAQSSASFPSASTLSASPRRVAAQPFQLNVESAERLPHRRASMTRTRRSKKRDLVEGLVDGGLTMDNLGWHLAANGPHGAATQPAVAPVMMGASEGTAPAMMKPSVERSGAAVPAILEVAAKSNLRATAPPFFPSKPPSPTKGAGDRMSSPEPCGQTT